MAIADPFFIPDQHVMLAACRTAPLDDMQSGG
jgi:hypothetical protein